MTLVCHSRNDIRSAQLYQSDFQYLFLHCFPQILNKGQDKANVKIISFSCISIIQLSTFSTQETQNCASSACGHGGARIMPAQPAEMGEEPLPPRGSACSSYSARIPWPEFPWEMWEGHRHAAASPHCHHLALSCCKGF